MKYFSDFSISYRRGRFNMVRGLASRLLRPDRSDGGRSAITKYSCNSYLSPSFLPVNLFEHLLYAFALIRYGHLGV